MARALLPRLGNAQLTHAFNRHNTTGAVVIWPV